MMVLVAVVAGGAGVYDQQDKDLSITAQLLTWFYYPVLVRWCKVVRGSPYAGEQGGLKVVTAYNSLRLDHSTARYVWWTVVRESSPGMLLDLVVVWWWFSSWRYWWMLDNSRYPGVQLRTRKSWW